MCVGVCMSGGCRELLGVGYGCVGVCVCIWGDWVWGIGV